MGELRAIFSASKYFKLVCGAGNEDAEEVRKLCFIYTLGGANAFDVSARPEIVQAAVEGIDRAYRKASEAGSNIETRPFITVSVGMPGDHHVRKAIITDACVECGKCIPVCPTDAIPESYDVIREKCIGCGNCEAACPPMVAAVKYEHNGPSLRELLPRCIAAGAENIELHAAVPDPDTVLEEMKIVAAAQPSNFVSMCLDRLHLSNGHLVDRVRAAGEIAGDRLMIQADGVPMSGGTDDYNTTLQAIACADVIVKDLIQKDRRYRSLPILLSGGTNTCTGDLARMCGVPFAGVSIGTHARKIVRPFVQDAAIFGDPIVYMPAVALARELISRNIGPPESRKMR